jgi:hypothetical protein
MNQVNRNYFNMAGKVCVMLASALLVAACGSGGGGGDDEEAQVVSELKGPQFSLDVEAFCGDPVAIEYDIEGINTFNNNVAVRLTDVSDDNGPADPEVGLLTIECTAAVKQPGGKKPDDRLFATIELPDPGFGLIDAICPLGSLPEGATEWKATATASGGDVRRDVFDICEEIAVP